MQAVDAAQVVHAPPSPRFSPDMSKPACTVASNCLALDKFNVSKMNGELKMLKYKIKHILVRKIIEMRKKLTKVLSE